MGTYQNGFSFRIGCLCRYRSGEMVYRLFILIGKVFSAQIEDLLAIVTNGEGNFTLW